MMAENANEEQEDVLVETDHYAEESPLAYLFGDTARVKIISTFVSERGRDISISEIARLSGVSRSTVYNHIDSLQRLGVIKHTRDVSDGHSSLYQLNEDSEIADLCYKLDGITLQKLIEENHLD
ncbi:winged helix-turn-helix domain-containing protein [Halolamina salina]|uniref:Winged helix-turn-helix domain-containing protein n=2 Tax=Halolamina salina TaxID=1220023 RepID=A0ABD6BAG1_9EURY